MIRANEPVVATLLLERERQLDAQPAISVFGYQFVTAGATDFVLGRFHVVKQRSARTYLLDLTIVQQDTKTVLGTVRVPIATQRVFDDFVEIGNLFSATDDARGRLHIYSPTKDALLCIDSYRDAAAARVLFHRKHQRYSDFELFYMTHRVHAMEVDEASNTVVTLRYSESDVEYVVGMYDGDSGERAAQEVLGSPEAPATDMYPFEVGWRRNNDQPVLKLQRAPGTGRLCFVQLSKPSAHEVRVSPIEINDDHMVDWSRLLSADSRTLACPPLFGEPPPQIYPQMNVQLLERDRFVVESRSFDDYESVRTCFVDPATGDAVVTTVRLAGANRIERPLHYRYLPHTQSIMLSGNYDAFAWIVPVNLIGERRWRETTHSQFDRPTRRVVATMLHLRNLGATPDYPNEIFTMIINYVVQPFEPDT